MNVVELNVASGSHSWTGGPVPCRLVVALVALLAGLPSLACGSSQPGSGRWVGKAYALEIPKANWYEPRGIGGDIGDFVPQFLLAIESAGTDALKVTVATGAAGTQNGCNRTTSVTMSGAAYPDTEIVVPEFPMHLVDAVNGIVVDTSVHDLAISNVLPGDIPADEGRFTAVIDVGEVCPLFTKIPDVTRDAVCMQLSAFGAPCAVCAHNSMPYCLKLTAIQLGAVQSPTAVRTIAAADVPATCA